MRGCSCRGTAGFVHVSCLAEQAKILFAEAEENNLGNKVMNERFSRWYSCSLCEQNHHGVVRCALGWACWKTYLGRPETDETRGMAMNVLGNGLTEADLDEEALSVMEADLAMMRRLGASEDDMLAVQGNLAGTYRSLGRLEDCLRTQRDVYSGWLKLKGEKHVNTLVAANNYASSLAELKRFEEAKTLLRKMMPVARRVLGESHDVLHKMRWSYAQSLYRDTGATLDDLREAVETLEAIAPLWKRVLGESHPETPAILRALKEARKALAARAASSSSAA